MSSGLLHLEKSSQIIYIRKSLLRRVFVQKEIDDLWKSLLQLKDSQIN